MDIKNNIQLLHNNQYLSGEQNENINKWISQINTIIYQRKYNNKIIFSYKSTKQSQEKQNYKLDYCNCKINICNCKNPDYELIKANNNYFCNNCNKWKCRCNKI